MIKTAHFDVTEILPIEDAALLPESEIGEAGTALAQLSTYCFPFPSRYVVTRSFFDLILQEDKHIKNIADIFAQVDWSQETSINTGSEKIQSYIRQLTLSESVMKIFAQAYLSWLENHFISLSPSLLYTPKHKATADILPIQGEANIVESLLHVWASVYSPHSLRERYDEWQKKQYVPTAIIIEILIPAESSGYAQPGEQKHLLHVYAHPGVTQHVKNIDLAYDHFVVDMRTWNIVKRSIAHKNQEYIYQLDSIKEKPLPPAQQATATLNNAEVLEIAKLLDLVQIKVKMPVSLKWLRDAKRLYVTHIDTTLLSSPTRTTKHHTQIPSATKVFVSFGNPSTSTTDAAHLADGIGLLRSEYILLQLGSDPFHLLQHGKGRVIHDTLVQALTHTYHLKTNSLVLYRSQNFTTRELSHLSHSQEIEPKEDDAYLGYRGALRILHDFSLFDVELDALASAQAHTSARLAMMIPFVRTVSEFALLKRHIQKRNHTTIPLWMQCNTPENLLQIQHYAAQGVAGFSINLQSIHALLHGISPDNSDVFSLYPLDVPLIESLLVQVKQSLTNYQLPIVLQMEDYTAEFVRLAVELGFTGVTVQPLALQRAKEIIQELESIRVHTYG